MGFLWDLMGLLWYVYRIVVVCLWGCYGDSVELS